MNSTRTALFGPGRVMATASVQAEIEARWDRTKHPLVKIALKAMDSNGRAVRKYL